MLTQHQTGIRGAMIIKQIIGALVGLLLGVGVAFGQANICINGSGANCGGPFTGTTITPTGQNFASQGQLYGASWTGGQFTAAFSLSFWIKTTALASTSALVPFIDTRNEPTNTLGFIAYSDSLFTSSVPVGFIVNDALANCETAGVVCTRRDWLNDGNWHHVCDTTDGASNVTMYIDGVIRDQNNQRFTSTTNNTKFWAFGPANFALSERESAAWNRQLSAAECAVIANRGVAGFDLLSGNAPATLSTGLVGYWKLGNCTGSGASLSCPESSGSGAPALTFDLSPPTLAILTPSAGTVSGTQSLTASCSDPIACSSVTYLVAASATPTMQTPIGSINSATVSPYTVAWDTTKVPDGTYILTATGINHGGAVGTSATVTVTTSNSVANKQFFVDPTSGTDCPANNGLSSGAPCSTLAGLQSAVNSNPVISGDSITFKAGTNMNLANLTAATEFSLAGPSCTSGICGANQNYYPGPLRTIIGTYGGSGNCHVEAAVTTDCASITFSANGTVLQYSAMINVFNGNNVTTQNLRLFGEQTNAQICSGSFCSSGIRYAAAGGYNNGSAPYTIIQNVETEGFSGGFFIGGVTTPTNASFGFWCNIQVLDNYVHGATSTDPIGAGIYITSLVSCPSTSISYVSNVINNIGGTAGNNDGSGVVTVNGAVNIADNFNVSGNIGANNTTCGGPYANWWYQTNKGSIIGNESYNVFPTVANGCDKGAFDFDNGTANLTFEDNYAHNTYGPSLSVLVGSVGGITPGNNLVAYNIFENGNVLTTNTNGSMLSLGAAIGYFHEFNNTIWNGFNGQIVSPQPTRTLNAAMGLLQCPPATSYLVNNISVSNSLAFTANAEFFYGNFGGNYNCIGNGNGTATVQVKTNDWFAYGTGSANLLWRSINGTSSFGASYTSVATWNAGVSANDIGSNPGFAGSPPLVTTCTAVGSGIPIQPGLIPCPTGYEITNGAATENTGTDLSQAPYSLYATILDYYGNTVPYSGHGGTGTNIGADGAFR